MRPVAALVSRTAFLLITGIPGTVYASTGTTTRCGSGRLSFEMRDRDETWLDTVTGTWVAANMAPGQTFAFDGSFARLRTGDDGRLTITCEYNVVEGQPFGDVDKYQTNLHADAMAEKLILTSCLHKYGTSGRSGCVFASLAWITPVDLPLALQRWTTE